ncbi:MAG: hypothetical protein J6U54_02150 [Clostridiales bacterium]|nr:hypothetical protein [Clostridiales bacterium]
MSRIESIDEGSVYDHKPITTDGGKTLSDNIDKLIELYRGVSQDCFGSGDESTTHDAVDMMISELTDLKHTINGAEGIVDSLVIRIRDEIIKEEDRIANSI